MFSLKPLRGRVGESGKARAWCMGAGTMTSGADESAKIRELDTFELSDRPSGERVQGRKIELSG